MVRSRKSNPGRAARHGRTEQGISVMAEDIETVRPKKRKKKNALKHGVYSREVMLPGEHTRDYDALAAELTEEWAPEGLTERRGGGHHLVRARRRLWRLHRGKSAL